MKEFILTQSYATIEDMENSDEMSIYNNELKQGDIEDYVVISRIGNRYDILGNKIDGLAKNPFYKNKNMEGNKMKYVDIEALIDKEIENAVAEIKEQYEKEIAELKSQHENELANAKELVKAEILAKING